MDQLVLLFLLMLGAVVTVPLGERLGAPPPILMTLLGVGLALVPFVPAVDVPSDLVLALILPPLLYTAARRSSWRQFAANWQPILLLAVALVVVTMVAVALVVRWLLPGLPLAAALAFGALLAPPDPVAATSVSGSVGLPRRLVSLLEGEGLFNDVTAIVLYQVAIAAAVTGAFSLPDTLWRFVLSAVVAVVVGFALGWVGSRLMDRLGDTTLQIGLSLLVPFVAYTLAEQFEGSGVLAVVIAAFLIHERMGADPDAVEGRLAGESFWNVVDTLVTGLAFGLIGLELRTVIDNGSAQVGRMLGWAAVIVGVVLGVRLLWLLPTTWLARKVRRLAGFDPDVPLSTRETVVMWWAGMRGVVSIALVLALPHTTDHGPFPDRAALVFIAFAVIIVTLIGQGLTLPWVVGRLGVTADAEAEHAQEADLAERITRAATQVLEDAELREKLPPESLEKLSAYASLIAARISPELAEQRKREADSTRGERVRVVRRIQEQMMSAARQAVLDARRSPTADPEVVDRVLRRLDARSLR